MKTVSNTLRDALLGRVWDKAKANPELAFVPAVLLGIFGVRCLRRRRSPEDDLMLPDLSALIPSEGEEYEMKHPVHSLSAEDFELLIALIYQRQGHRVSMLSALSGGRRGDFLLLRKPSVCWCFARN